MYTFGFRMFRGCFSNSVLKVARLRLDLGIVVR
jgi:hypothetical protein